MTKQAKLLLRILAALLCLLFFFFGATLGNGFCLGDRIMTGLGLSPWSRGTGGTHYPAVIALAGIFGFFVLFTCTTEQKARTFRRLISGTLTALFLSALIYVLLV